RPPARREGVQDQHRLVRFKEAWLALWHLALADVIHWIRAVELPGALGAVEDRLDVPAQVVDRLRGERRDLRLQERFDVARSDSRDRERGQAGVQEVPPGVALVAAVGGGRLRVRVE